MRLYQLVDDEMSSKNACFSDSYLLAALGHFLVFLNIFRGFLRFLGKGLGWVSIGTNLRSFCETKFQKVENRKRTTKTFFRKHKMGVKRFCLHPKSRRLIFF